MARRDFADTELDAEPVRTLTSRSISTPRHTTHLLECGPTGGPLMIFLHGWPGIPAGTIAATRPLAFPSGGPPSRSRRIPI